MTKRGNTVYERAAFVELTIEEQSRLLVGRHIVSHLEKLQKVNLETLSESSLLFGKFLNNS